MPAPSTKKGRFSWKRVSKAVRLTTAGSTSTWPKSGLMVAPRVRLELSPVLQVEPRAIEEIRSVPVRVVEPNLVILFDGDELGLALDIGKELQSSGSLRGPGCPPGGHTGRCRRPHPSG